MTAAGRLSRRWVVAYWLWVAALAVTFVTVRPAQTGVIALAGLTGSAAIVHGIDRHQPVRRWPWFCLAAAVALSGAAQVMSRLLPGAAATYRPGDAAVYIVAAGMSAAMVVGVIGLARSAPRDLSAAVDVTILLLGTGLLVGVLVAAPYALTPDLPPVQAAARVFFVARDVVLLAAFIHFATSERWNTSMALLVGGVAALLAYDASYRLALIHGVDLQGTPVELLSLLFAASWGMASLVPTMRRLGEPADPSRRSVTLRLGLLGVAAALPVTLLILAIYERISQRYEAAVAIASALMLDLVLSQLLAAALKLRDQVQGERALSRAVADVAAQDSRTGVAGVLEASVPLLGSGRASRRVLAVMHDQPSDVDAVPEAPEGSVGILVTQPPSAVRDRLGTGPVLARRMPVTNPVDGSTLYLRGDRATLNDLSQRLDVLLTQAGQVLERIRLNAELIRRTTEEYLNAVAYATGDAIVLVDDDDRITLASRSAASAFGTSDLVGVRLPDLVDREARAPVTELLDRARTRGPTLEGDGITTTRRGRSAETVPPPPNLLVEPKAHVDTASWTTRRRDGTEVQLEIACRRVVSTEPSVRGLLVDLRDVTELRRLERDMSERAARDPLTGLITGPGIRERARQELDEHGGQLVGMIVLDVNEFKLINNEYGQEFGDNVLKAIADRLVAALPPDVLTGRVSGDRFAVIATIASPAEADEIATRLLATIAQPIIVDGDVVHCTASAGISTSADTSTAPELVRQADLALLIAQDRGRGQWHHYEPSTHSAVLERLEIRAALERAIDEQQLALCYQPIIDLDTGFVDGFEALIRWRHPTYEDLSPDKFMHVAEESKLIVPIGTWVLETAVDDARRWDRVVPAAPPFVSVNVTATEFAAPGFCDTIRDKLDASGLPASRLHLEITESSLLNDGEVWDKLQQLRDTGVRIAIDDFGTGYSALSYLGRVPVDRIKLDRHFTTSMTNSRTQRDLVEGIVTLARTLNLDVIAEGIEDARVRDLATEVGCRFGQGYLFGRPMTAEATVAWLSEQTGGTHAAVIRAGRS